MMNKYVIRHEITYTSNGCSCCEATEWDTFFVSFGDLDEYGKPIERGYQDLEQAYEAILEREGIDVVVVYEVEDE